MAVLVSNNCHFHGRREYQIESINRSKSGWHFHRLLSTPPPTPRPHPHMHSQSHIDAKRVAVSGRMSECFVEATRILLMDETFHGYGEIRSHASEDCMEGHYRLHHDASPKRKWTVHNREDDAKQTHRFGMHYRKRELLIWFSSLYDIWITVKQG